MLSAQSAFTLEIDDVDAAVEEILDQLDLESLKSNSVGLVGCLPDFYKSGVVAALQEALPFDLIGQSTIGASTVGSDTLEQLSILVLTSDDIEFAIALSTSVSGESIEPLANAYAEATAGHEEKPSLIVAYTPLLLTASGDFFVNAINEISGDVPLFGSIAVDDTLDYGDSRTIYKGEVYADQLVYLLFYGNIKPKFFIANITHNRIINETGVVTSSVGSQLMSINDAPVPVYLEDRGIMPNEQGEYEGINSVPYIVDYNDGTEPVIRVMFAITPDGYAVCGGDIPIGATLAVSLFDKNEILESSGASIERMASALADEGSVILAFSCIGRYFTLEYDLEAEAQMMHDIIDKSGIPYTLTYSGGEICPSPNKGGSGAFTNRAHNSTFVAVVL